MCKSGKSERDGNMGRSMARLNAAVVDVERFERGHLVLLDVGWNR